MKDALGLYRDALVCSPACSSNQPGLAISSSDEALLDGQAAHSTAAATLHDMARLKDNCDPNMYCIATVLFLPLPVLFLMPGNAWRRTRSSFALFACFGDPRKGWEKVLNEEK